jgi:hypothetical protein
VGLKQILTNLSWETLINLPPSELLSIALLIVLAVVLLVATVLVVSTFFD